MILVSLCSAAAQSPTSERPPPSLTPQAAQGETFRELTEKDLLSEPRRARSAEEAARPSSYGKVYRHFRFNAGLVGGLLVGSVAGGLTYVGSKAQLCRGGDHDFSSPCNAASLFAATLIAADLQSLSTWGIGTLLDGDGHFLTILPGPLLALGIFSLMHWLAPSALYVAPIAGLAASAFLGASLFERTSHVSARAARELQVRVVPTVLPSRMGGVVPGLALGGGW